MAKKEDDQNEEEEEEDEDENEKEAEDEEDEEKQEEEEENEEDSEDSEEEIEVPDKFEDLIEQIESLTVAELAELVDILEEKFGVTPAAAAPQGSGQANAGEGEEGSEQSSFDVVLEEIGDAKIKVIKAIREITGKGLKESKDLVDSAPEPIQESVSEDKANEIKEQVEEAGGTVKIQ